MSPYWQKLQEDKAWEHERYERVPILGPVTSGGEPVALDPPSDDEVIRALEKVRPVGGGIPLLWERQRNNVRIRKDLIADYVDHHVFTHLLDRHSSITPITNARSIIRSTHGLAAHAAYR